jgi:hypothetical protein
MQLVFDLDCQAAVLRQGRGNHLCTSLLSSEGFKDSTQAAVQGTKGVGALLRTLLCTHRQSWSNVGFCWQSWL